MELAYLDYYRDKYLPGFEIVVQPDPFALMFHVAGRTRHVVEHILKNQVVEVSGVEFRVHFAVSERTLIWDISWGMSYLHSNPGREAVQGLSLSEAYSTVPATAMNSVRESVGSWARWSQQPEDYQALWATKKYTGGYRLSFHRATPHAAPMNVRNEKNLNKDHKDLLKQAFMVAVYGNQFLPVEMPVELHLDQYGRLHNTEGPAVLWKSGANIYFLEGIEVPHWFFQGKGVTRGKLNRVGNAERRRVLINMVGVENFLKVFDAEEIDRNESYGVLYKLPPFPFESEADDTEVRVLRVENSTLEPDGSRREYFLRVPPTTKSAEAAAAWTFGMEPSEYNVVAES